MVGSDIYDRRRVNMLKINTTAIERIVNQRQDIETIIVSGHTGTEKRGGHEDHYWKFYVAIYSFHPKYLTPKFVLKMWRTK